MSIFEAFFWTVGGIVYAALWVLSLGQFITAGMYDGSREKARLIIAGVVITLLITHFVWFIGNLPSDYQ